MSNTGNTQQIIDYGAAPNDGTGDPLRVAFEKTDENFSNIWLAGPVGSNLTIANNTIQANNTNGNLILKPNGVGIVQVNASIVPDLDQLRDLGSANNRFRSVYFSGNINTSGSLSVADITVTGDADLQGNVVVDGNLTVNGTTLTVNVANLDISDKNIVIANGSPNSAAANGAGITIAGANATITYVSGTDSLDFNKDLIVTGNVTGSYIIGNGSQLTGLPASYSNANVASFLVSNFGSVGSNSIQTVGNVSARAIDVANIQHQFPIGIQTNGGGLWEIAGNIFRAPEGGTWESTAETLFLTSPANGSVQIHALNDGNIVSDITWQHDDITVTVQNGGVPKSWRFNDDGTTEFPNYQFPYDDGSSGQVLVTNGAGSLAWGNADSYGNIQVANFLQNFGSNSISTVGNVSATRVNTGNITSTIGTIQIDPDGGLNRWQFGDNGFLTFPSGAQWSSQQGVEDDYILSASNGFLNLQSLFLGNLASEINLQHDLVRLKVYNGPDEEWDFKADGTLCTPGNICVKAANTHVVGNASHWWSTIYSQQFVGNSISVSGVVQTGDIIPQSNGTASLGNATNYWSNLWVANNTIYIGGVPLGITAGNVLTVAGEPVLTNDSNTAITTTGNITAGNILTDNYLYANGSPFVSASTGNITFTNTTMSPPDGVDIFITAANSEVEITGLDFRVDVTDDVRIIGNDIVSLRNRSSTEDITITTDLDGNAETWTFAADGTLSTPGDIVVNGDVTGTAGSSTLVIKAQPDSNTAIQLNNIVDSEIRTVANLEIRTDVSNTAQVWQFGTDGVLTTPGDIDLGGRLTATTGQLNLEAANNPNAYIQLNDTGDSLFGAAGNLSLLTDGDSQEWVFDTNGDLTVPNYINFKGNTFIGDEPGAGSPAFRIVAPLTYGATIETDSDISGNSWTWTFGADGVLGAPGNITATNFIGSIAAANVTGLANVATTGAYADLTGTPTIPSLGDFTITNNTIQTGNGVGGITLSIFGPDAADPPAFISRDWLFANTGAFTSPGAISATGNITASANIVSGNGGNIVLGNATSRLRQNGSNATVQLNGSVTLTPDTSASASNGVIIGGNGYLLAPNSSRNAQLNYGGDSGTMGIYRVNIYGNQTTAIVNGGTSGVGNIGANTSNRFNTAFLTEVDASGNVSAGNVNATTEVTVDALSITNSSIAAVTQFTISTSNTATGNSSSILMDRNGVGVVVQLEDTSGGPYSWGLYQDNILFPDGSRQYSAYGNANVVANLAALGSNPISTTGNVSAGNFIGAGSNVELVAGNYTWTFDNTGNSAFANGTVSITDLVADGDISGVTLISTNSSGSEGGEIQLAAPAANTTISGGVIIDSYQDQLRFFESGGNNRGMFVDFSTITTGQAAIGYRDIPQVAFTADATLAATDAGKHYYSTLSTANVLTIANNSSVSWPVGTAITVVNRGTGNITVAQGSGVSLYLAGNSTAGNRTVTTYGMATLLNVAANVWMINGTGVS